MNRTPEQWAQVDPADLLASPFTTIEEAIADIAELAGELAEAEAMLTEGRAIAANMKMMLTKGE